MNYDTLVENVRTYLDVDSTTLSDDQIDVFFRLCESKINRSLRTMEMVTRSYTLGIDGVEYYSVPDDFNGIREIKVNDISLKYITPELQTGWEESEISGNPRYFSITNGQFRIQPAPSENDEIEIIYYQKVTPLATDTGDGQDVNWISSNWPDIYLYGLLYEANEFLYDEPKMAAFKTKFENAMLALRTQDIRDRWSGPLEIRYVP